MSQKKSSGKKAPQKTVAAAKATAQTAIKKSTSAFEGYLAPPTNLAHRANSGSDGLRSRFSVFFAKLSENPWISNPIRLFFLSSALWLLLIFILAFTAPPASWSLEVQEAPLYQNTQIQIAPGETYTYEIKTPSQTSFASMSAKIVQGCSGLLLYDPAAYASLRKLETASVCVDAHGRQLSSRAIVIGTNSTYANITWPYFSPWMLAVSDDWEWSANATFAAGMQWAPGAGQLGMQQFVWKTVGNSSFGGRGAWLVSIAASGQGNGMWREVSLSQIDAEKRVLLKMQSGNLTIRLVKAPFPLNFSSQTS